jgi:hypothetical protein
VAEGAVLYNEPMRGALSEDQGYEFGRSEAFNITALLIQIGVVLVAVVLSFLVYYFGMPRVTIPTPAQIGQIQQRLPNGEAVPTPAQIDQMQQNFPGTSPAVQSIQ